MTDPLNLESDDVTEERARMVLSVMFTTRLVVAVIGFLAGAGVIWALTQ